MFNTSAISKLSDSGVRANRQWIPNQLYQGFVKTIQSDGSIEVMINNRVYQALSHQSARPGDLLSLRLLGTQPEPHFAIVGILRRATQDGSTTTIRSNWQEAGNLLRNMDSGLSALHALWQRYPEQLARLGWQLPALMSTLKGSALDSDALTKPGRLKAHVLGSGSFYEAGGEDADAAEDLKPLLFRLLQVLQPNRQLTLQQGRPVFSERPGVAAQTLQDKSVALYVSEQETGAGSTTLKQLLTLNVESALLRLVSDQLQSIEQTDDGLSLWIMQIALNYRGLIVPVALEFRHQMDAENQYWELNFTLKLPHSGKIRAQLAVKNSSARIHLRTDNGAVAGLWNSQQLALKHRLEKFGLMLREFSVSGEETQT